MPTSNIKDLVPDRPITLYRAGGKIARFQVTLVATCLGQMRQHFSNTLEDIWLYWKGEHLEYYEQEDKMRLVAEEFLAAYSEALPAEWISHWNDLDSTITKKAYEIHALDLTGISMPELKAHYDQLLATKRSFWALSIFIDALDAGDDHTAIEKIAARHALSSGEVETLLSADFPAYITAWEQELYQVAQGRKSIEQVIEKFFWIRTDYLHFAELDEEYIREEAARAHNVPWVSPRDTRAEILKAHNLATNPLEVFRVLTEWRDTRKRINFTALYALMRILTELLRRYEIPGELLRWKLPHEAEALFTTSLSNEHLERITERSDTSMLLRVQEDGSYVFIEGEDADTAHKELLSRRPQEDSKELKGSIASRGKVQGRVRIVPHPDSPSGKLMQKGDILVTSMTRPEFLPLMKIAGAIVTDEGGITSHAAIVSREMRIPCIIGTRNATEVLKDGDMVEVDADQGIVRVIERGRGNVYK